MHTLSQTIIFFPPYKLIFNRRAMAHHVINTAYMLNEVHENRYFKTCASLTENLLFFQDWLNKQTDWSRALLSDLFLGRRWLMQMGGAAEKFGISIQYCTSYSRHILQSVVIPSVTQVTACVITAGTTTNTSGLWCF